MPPNHRLFCHLGLFCSAACIVKMRVSGEFTFHQERQKRDKMLLAFCELKNNFLRLFESSLIKKISYLPFKVKP